MANKRKIDVHAKARDSYGLNTREGARIQNVINAELGSKKRRDWTNMPTANQMKVAKAGKSEIVAGIKADRMALIAMGVMKGNSDKEIDKALKNARNIVVTTKPKKTKHSGTMMGGL